MCCNEINGSSDHSLGLVAMRRVSAARQLQQVGVRDMSRDTVDLRHRAVFVVLALHRQHRPRDRGQRASMFQLRKAGSSQMSFQPQNAESGSS